MKERRKKFQEKQKQWASAKCQKDLEIKVIEKYPDVHLNNSLGYLRMKFNFEFEESKCSYNKLSEKEKITYKEILQCHPSFNDHIGSFHKDVEYMKQIYMNTELNLKGQREPDQMNFESIQQYFHQFKIFQNEVRTKMNNFWDIYQRGRRNNCSYIIFFIGKFKLWPGYNDEIAKGHDEFLVNNWRQQNAIKLVLKNYILENEELKFVFWQSFIRFFKGKKEGLVGIEFRKEISFNKIKNYMMRAKQMLEKYLELNSFEIFNANQFLMDIRYFINEEQQFLAYIELKWDMELFQYEQLPEKDKKDKKIVKKIFSTGFEYLSQYIQKQEEDELQNGKTTQNQSNVPLKKTKKSEKNRQKKVFTLKQLY